MDLREFISKIHSSAPFVTCLDKVKKGDHFTVTGLGSSGVSFLVSSLSENLEDQLMVITSDQRSAEQLQSDTESICDTEINYFPSYRGLHLQEMRVNNDIKFARLKSLQKLNERVPGIYIVEIRALLNSLVSPNVFQNRILTLEKGSQIEFEFLVNYLVEEGFTRQSMVEDLGELSVRGGIIDIFPPNYLEPVRVEFFGDTIESIRIFDINEQRSIRETDSVVIVPPAIDVSTGTDINLPDTDSSILSYFSDSAPIIFHQPLQSQKKLIEYHDNLRREYGQSGTAKQEKRNTIFDELEERLEDRSSAYIRCNITASSKKKNIHFDFKTVPQFNRSLKRFARTMNELHADHSDLTVAVMCDNQGQADRLKDLILDENLLSSNYFVQTGSLSAGFIYPECSLVFINDHEIFSRKHFAKPKRIYRARKVVFDELSLQIGDYVVHEEHGIGRYMGLEKIAIGRSEQEALKIEYRNNDSLYLNIEKLPNLEKYTGKEGYKPELSKLGGTDWNRIKKRTKKSAVDIADDLINLYSKRANIKGYAFGSDTHWQRELEASFQYDDTPDQQKASWDIKKDMESEKPMDRLVCGDVGFGKTEVALRAAFKAVNDSKQVAILVPTTILAQQHYETFRERLKEYPVNIEMLSRFRTPKEQKSIVDGMRKGLVDIVIGTHRLLSKDIEFKNLGLIVIDEEQRFGVTNKEKLKRLRTQVDVLTMTATPIPRTMHMSIMGVRDLSVINTPPKNRLPIITEISQYDDDLVRAAITKELDRGGQIYFVHNRVQTIYKMKKKLEKLVPEARYEVAHGQMKERELEKVMLSFLRGEFACLISTMIIESGLDIPSVNTIIIDHADHFGLAQLYQLRGRVGRSDIQAFAYLLTPPFETMTDESVKRLQTISEHMELGSGYRISLKDLEIRGTGNLLGSEQSGHINAVGFDMYTRLIKDSVAERMQEAIPENGNGNKHEGKISDVRIDTDVPAFLPQEYIPDSFQRVSFYRRIALTDTVSDLETIRSDLRDRFGALPESADNIIKIMELKICAAKLSMHRLKVANDKFAGSFSVGSESSASHKEHLARLLSSFVDKSKYPFHIKQEKNLTLELPLNNENESDHLNYVLNFLSSLQETSQI